MKRKINIIGLTLFFTLTLFSLAFSEESITITTYYPSPYGSYNELTTTGNTYLATTSGKVGIGTASPAEKLEITGNIKLSGASATYKIGNVANPTAAQDVATKAYVDAGAMRYVITTRLAWQNNSCPAAPADFCPTGWSIEQSWSDCVLNAVTGGGLFYHFMTQKQTLCSK